MAAGIDNPCIVGLENEGYPAILGDMSDLEPLDDRGVGIGGGGGDFDVTDSINATSPLEDNDDILSRIVRTEEEDQEEEKPCHNVSQNPYLNGDSIMHS